MDNSSFDKSQVWRVTFRSLAVLVALLGLTYLLTDGVTKPRLDTQHAPQVAPLEAATG